MHADQLSAVIIARNQVVGPASERVPLPQQSDPSIADNLLSSSAASCFRY
jgi:hypothetical protein